jgi:hypothetical protein
VLRVYPYSIPLVPDISGRYEVAGTHEGKLWYIRTDGAYRIYWNGGLSNEWRIDTSFISQIEMPLYFQDDDPVEDIYAIGQATGGDAVVEVI